jgi:hypothetical protein
MGEIWNGHEILVGRPEKEILQRQQFLFEVGDMSGSHDGRPVGAGSKNLWNVEIFLRD